MRPRPPAIVAGSDPEVPLTAVTVEGTSSPAARVAESVATGAAGAVLPGLPGSVQAAQALRLAGKEVILHLPMEPRGYPEVRPGPGVVVRGQSEEEIAETVARDLASVPGAIGVNNHMGSAATADPLTTQGWVMSRATGKIWAYEPATDTDGDADKLLNE